MAYLPHLTATGKIKSLKSYIFPNSSKMHISPKFLYSFNYLTLSSLMVSVPCSQYFKDESCVLCLRWIPWQRDPVVWSWLGGAKCRAIFPSFPKRQIFKSKNWTFKAPTTGVQSWTRHWSLRQIMKKSCELTDS